MIAENKVLTKLGYLLLQTDLQLQSQLPAFTLIGPDVGYAGVCAQAEICAPKLCVRKMCSGYF